MRYVLVAAWLLILPGCVGPTFSGEDCNDGRSRGESLPPSFMGTWKDEAFAIVDAIGDQAIEWSEVPNRVGAAPGYLSTDRGWIFTDGANDAEAPRGDATIHYHLKYGRGGSWDEHELLQMIRDGMGSADEGWTIGDDDLGRHAELRASVGDYVSTGGRAAIANQKLEITLYSLPDLRSVGRTIPAEVAAERALLFAECVLEGTEIAGTVTLEDDLLADQHLIRFSEKGAEEVVQAPKLLMEFDSDGSPFVTFEVARSSSNGDCWATSWKVGVDIQTGHVWTTDDSLLQCASGIDTAYHDGACSGGYTPQTPVKPLIQDTAGHAANSYLERLHIQAMSDPEADPEANKFVIRTSEGTLSYKAPGAAIDEPWNQPFDADGVITYYPKGTGDADSLDRLMEAALGLGDSKNLFVHTTPQPLYRRAFALDADHANPSFAVAKYGYGPYVALVGMFWELEDPQAVMSENALIAALSDAGTCYATSTSQPDMAVGFIDAWPIHLDGHAAYVGLFVEQRSLALSWEIWHRFGGQELLSNCSRDFLLAMDPTNGSWRLLDDRHTDEYCVA